MSRSGPGSRQPCRSKLPDIKHLRLRRGGWKVTCDASSETPCPGRPIRDAIPGTPLSSGLSLGLDSRIPDHLRPARDLVFDLRGQLAGLAAGGLYALLLEGLAHLRIV